MTRWNALGTLAKGHIIGELTLKQTINHKVFLGHFENSIRQKFLPEILEIVPRLEGVKNVSELRSKLSKEPDTLGLTEIQTRDLRALFLDVRSAVEYTPKD